MSQYHYPIPNKAVELNSSSVPSKVKCYTLSKEELAALNASLPKPDPIQMKESKPIGFKRKDKSSASSSSAERRMTS